MSYFGEGFSSTQFAMEAFTDFLKKGQGDKYMVAQWQGSPMKRDAKVLIPSKLMIYIGNQPCGEIGDRDCLRQRALNLEDPM